ncbi:hypothetical protein [Gordonia iterans]
MPDLTDNGQTDPSTPVRTGIDRLGGACGRHNRMNGKTPGHRESTVLAFGPDAGRVGWRPAGRGTRWQSNILFHPERLAPDSGHGHRATAAGPDDLAPPGDLGTPENLGPYGDTGPPVDLGPPEEKDPDLDLDDDRSNPTIIVHHRPFPIRAITPIAPIDPLSGAEQILARLLAQAA